MTTDVSAVVARLGEDFLQDEAQPQEVIAGLGARPLRHGADSFPTGMVGGRPHLPRTGGRPLVGGRSRMTSHVGG